MSKTVEAWSSTGRSAASTAVDVLFAGGGLASSLIALRLADQSPTRTIRVLERETQSAGEHTWCLFDSDVTPEQWTWLAPLFAHEWAAYDVCFPSYRRTLRSRYACITKESLRQRVDDKLGQSIIYGASVAEVGARHATLIDGTRYEARLVIDARGARQSTALKLAWQKFVGLEVQLTRPHEFQRPIVMDATVPQKDGFRFLYVLPLSHDRLLIEDTRYSASSRLDTAALETEIHAYAAARGLEIRSVVRREEGVLPVVLDGDPAALWKELGSGASVGMRGAFFHPTTGYSLPQAVATAFWIADQSQLDTESLAPALRKRAARHWNRGRLYRALNRMLFLAAEPHLRYRVLERFYRLSHGLIERFYAGRLTFLDKLRLLVGRPPVPVSRAVRALPTKAAWRRGVG